MEYSLELNPRPFEAIKNGTKKIEGRVPTEHNKNVPFNKIKEGDTIIFSNNSTGGIMRVLVLGVKHYSTFGEMLKSEGTERVLSSKRNIEEGIESFESFNGYKEGVKKHGVYAIEIEKID
ncbi:MAG: ASCH domain-containing protein [Nanoarchaeota archaeon]